MQDHAQDRVQGAKRRRNPMSFWMKTCPKCGEAKLVVKDGRFGQFTSCSNYPKCKYIKPKTVGVPCPKPGCGGEIIERRSKRGKVFYGCLKYPDCDFVVWNKPVPEQCPECGAPYLLEKIDEDEKASSATATKNRAATRFPLKATVPRELPLKSGLLKLDQILHLKSEIRDRKLDGRFGTQRAAVQIMVTLRKERHRVPSSAGGGPSGFGRAIPRKPRSHISSRRRGGVVQNFLATPPVRCHQRRLRCFFLMSRPPLLLLRRGFRRTTPLVFHVLFSILDRCWTQRGSA